MNLIYKLSFSLTISVLLVGFVNFSNAENSENKLVCYYGTWAYYRYGNGKCSVEDLDPNLCTHLVYAFANLQSDGSVVSYDTYLDIDLGNYEKFTALKKKNKDLKTLLAIGGWNAGVAAFSKIANDPALRTKFIQSALDFVTKYNFDGMDLDWEYPGNDREVFSMLVKEMYTAFKAKELLLTAAVAAPKSQASISYDIPVISQYLDFINVMAYDFYGPWNNRVGFNAPLGSDGDNDPLLVKNAIKYWISQGSPPKKLILGMPLYGKTFRLSNSASTTPGSSASGPGIEGKYTNTPGTIGLNELCEKNLTENWPEIWDKDARVPYTYKNYDWISYENVLSLQEKTEFALKNGLGGGMVWSIETDDFLNVCGNGKYVYLNTIKMVLNSNNAMTTEATTIETSTSKPITETSSTQFFTTKLTTVPSSEPTTVPTSEPTTIPPSKPTTVTPSKPITVPSSEPTTVPSSEPTTIPSSKPTAVPPSACKEPGINKHPTDQHKFISCVPKEDGSYILYEMICPANLIFNDNLKTCAYTNNLLLNDTICKEAGNNKHPTDHHKYYSCIKKADGAYLKYQMSCPENLVYQEKNKICNYPNKG